VGRWAGAILKKGTGIMGTRWSYIDKHPYFNYMLYQSPNCLDGYIVRCVKEGNEPYEVGKTYFYKGKFRVPVDCFQFYRKISKSFMRIGDDDICPDFNIEVIKIEATGDVYATRLSGAHGLACHTDMFTQWTGINFTDEFIVQKILTPKEIEEAEEKEGHMSTHIRFDDQSRIKSIRYVGNFVGSTKDLFLYYYHQFVTREFIYDDIEGTVKIGTTM